MEGTGNFWLRRSRNRDSENGQTIKRSGCTLSRNPRSKYKSCVVCFLHKTDRLPLFSDKHTFITPRTITTASGVIMKSVIATILFAAIGAQASWVQSKSQCPTSSRELMALITRTASFPRAPAELLSTNSVTVFKAKTSFLALTKL